MVRFPVLLTGRLYPRKFSWYSFPVRGYVCTTGDTAHIDTIFKFLPHTNVNMGAFIFFTAAMIRVFRTARSLWANMLHEMHVAQ